MDWKETCNEDQHLQDAHTRCCLLWYQQPAVLQEAKKALHAKMSALLDDVRENPFTLRLVLQPFTPQQTQAFLNAALDGVLVSMEVAHNLWEKTGGLPLYIEQACSLHFLRLHNVHSRPLLLKKH